MVDGCKKFNWEIDYEAFKAHIKDNEMFSEIKEGKYGRVSDVDKSRKTFTHSVKYGTSLTATIKEVRQNNNSIHANLTLSGSIHCNSKGGQNIEDFTFKQQIEEVNRISHDFDVEPENFEVQMMEFGLNISFPENVTQFVEHNLLMYGSKPFTDGATGTKTKKRHGYFIVDMGEYYIKCYNKDTEEKFDFGIMRFEIHPKKMNTYNRKLVGQAIEGGMDKDKALAEGINTLADLTDRDKMYKLYDILLDHWEKVMVFDEDVMQMNLNSLELSALDVEILTEGKHRSYWKRQHDESIIKYSRKRKRQRELMEKYSKTNYHVFIGKLLREKRDILMNGVKDETIQEAQIENAEIKVDDIIHPLTKDEIPADLRMTFDEWLQYFKTGEMIGFIPLVVKGKYISVKEKVVVNEKVVERKKGKTIKKLIGEKQPTTIIPLTDQSPKRIPQYQDST